MYLDFVCRLHPELGRRINAVVAQPDHAIASATERGSTIRFADFQHHGKTARNATNAQSAGATSRVAQNETPSASPKQPPATLASRSIGPKSPEVVYGRENDILQKILTSRRTQLDSATVAIIERNLSIIDAAISQSKAALARDPASRLLSDQLTHALDKKVELLRTAALLPLNT